MAHNTDRNLIQFVLTIIFVVVIAIFNWIKKHSQSGDSTDSGSERTPPPPPRPIRQPRQSVRLPSSPPVRRIGWEEQLRRALEGPQTEPPPLPPAPSRGEPRPMPPRPFLAPTPPTYTPRPAPFKPVMSEQDQGLPVELPGLTASAQSYQRASQLDENVAEHLRAIGKQVQLHPVRVQAGALSPEVTQARGLLQNRRSLRALIMASVILGPPKALES